MTMTSLDFDRDIEIDAIILNHKASNKKAAFGALAEHISAQMGVSPQNILDQLIIQESRQNSGIGAGVSAQAIALKQVKAAYTLMIVLARPIAFDAADDQPVDVLCLSVSPENEGALRLRRLSRISRLLKNEELLQKIRETDDEDTIRALIHNPQGWTMAA